MEKVAYLPLIKDDICERLIFPFVVRVVGNFVKDFNAVLRKIPYMPPIVRRVGLCSCRSSPRGCLFLLWLLGE